MIALRIKFADSKSDWIINLGKLRFVLHEQKRQLKQVKNHVVEAILL